MRGRALARRGATGWAKGRPSIILEEPRPGTAWSGDLAIPQVAELSRHHLVVRVRPRQQPHILGKLVHTGGVVGRDTRLIELGVAANQLGDQLPLLGREVL